MCYDTLPKGVVLGYFPGHNRKGAVFETARKKINIAEREKELLKRFHLLVNEEKKNLDYLKESIESVYGWNNKTYKLFLRDAMIKLERINSQRLNIQEEIIEEDE